MLFKCEGVSFEVSLGQILRCQILTVEKQKKELQATVEQRTQIVGLEFKAKSIMES